MNRLAEPILLVEDHADTLAVFARLLRQDAFDVHVARTCAEALALARARPFTLAICDIMLPDGDGCDLLRQIKALHPSIHAIAVSGLGAADDLERCRDAGFLVHVLKPMDYASVLPRVRAVLKGQADPNAFTTVAGAASRSV